MADNAQLEIRLRLEREIKQKNREQYENMFAGIARVQRDSRLVDFYDEADEIMHELDVPSTAMDLPPDSRVVARYSSMVRRVQGKLATSPQLPGASGSTPQSNIPPLNAAQHSALASQLGQAGINVNPLANFNAPMAGGQVPLGGRGRGRGVGQGNLPADIQRFSQQYQAELAQIGDEVFDRLERQVLSDGMREQAIDRARQIRDIASRQALRFPMTSPARAAVRDIERGAGEMHRRLSGQASQLGFAGAEQVRYDQDVMAPLQNIIRQGIGGGRISMDEYREARRDAELRRGEIRDNPNIDPSLARRRVEAIAQMDRQALQIARLSPEIVQRGTPGADLAGVSPGAVAGFQNLQRIRAELQGAREGPMGQLASNRQRELLAELQINEQINRVEEARLRAAGQMTRDRQHRFNVLQNEYRLTERDVEGAPVRLTAGDIGRQAAMGGPQSLIGQALQRIAFERGDVGQVGGLAMAGQLVAQRGFFGAAMGGMQAAGARTALAGAGILGLPTSGGLGALIGGMGALATIPIAGTVAAGAAFTLGQVGNASQLGMGASNLWRRGGGRDLQGLGNNFRDPSGFMTELLNAGQGLAFDRDEALAVSQALAQTGGLRGGGAGLIADRTRSTLRAARYLGVDANVMAQGMGTMESMNLVGTGPNRMSQDRFADLLASSISRGNMRGRENDVISAITSLTQTMAVRGITTPEMTQQSIGLITAMNASGSPGLRGQFGQQLLGQMDQSVTGARGLQEALLYQAYARQNGGRMDYLQFIEEQGKGAGSEFFLGGVQSIANLGGQDPRRRALALITQYFGGDRSKMGQARQMDELMTQGKLTPQAFEQLTSGTMETEGYQPGAGLQGIENLAEAQNSLIRNFQDLASALLPVIEGMTKLAGFFSGAAAGAVGTVTNPRPNRQLEAVPAAVDLPGVGIVELPPIHPDIETPIGPIPNPLHPEREAPELPVQPSETIIETPIGRITIPDIRIGPGGTPALPPAPAPNLPMPGPPGLPSAPMQPGPAEIPAAVRRITPIDQSASFARGIGNYCSVDTLTAIFRAQTGIDISEDEVARALGLFGISAGMPWGAVQRAVEILSERYGAGITTNSANNYPSFQSVIEAAGQGVPTLFSINDANAGALGFLGDHIVGVSRIDEEGRAVVFDSAHPYGPRNPNTGRRSTRAEEVPLTEPQLRQLMRGAGNSTTAAWTMRGFTGGGAAPTLPATPAPPPSAPSATMGGSADANRNAVIRTARRLGQNPALALSVIPAEGGFEDIMRFQANAPFGRNPLRDRRGNPIGARGMYQFDIAGELQGYLAFLKERGVVPGNITWEGLENIPEAWTPELQTEYFYRYAGQQGALVGQDATAEQIAVAAHRAQRNARTAANNVPGVGPGTRSFLEAAREVMKTPITLPPEEEPQSYTPMDREGQMAAQTINVAVTAPQQIMLVWPDGSQAGSINVDVDVPSSTDINAYRTMGYYT